MTDTRTNTATSNAGRGKLRFSIRTLLFFTALIASALAVLAWHVRATYRYNYPTWIESFAVQDNQLRVVDSSNRPMGDVLVIHMTGKTGMYGGWVGELRIPQAGAKQGVQMTFPRLESWDVRSDFTAVDGVVQIPRFEVRCQGRRSLPATFRSHGYCIIVVYKRGYQTQIVEPLINQVHTSDVVLKRIRLEDYAQHGYEVHSDREALHNHDDVQLDCLRELSMPFWLTPRVNGPAARAYWDHELSNGETVAAFALREMETLQGILKSDYVRKQLTSMMATFRKQSSKAVDSEQPQNSATRDSIP